MPLYVLFAFVLGAIFGSFLNVVILRYNSGFSLGGRSMCFSCGKRLGFAELVPIVSFVALRGKCKECRTAISMQYPLVELVTALCFSGIYTQVFGTGIINDPKFIFLAILFLAIWSSLILIAAYDLRHKIIPDFFVSIFIILSLVQGFVQYGVQLFNMPHLLDVLFAGPMLALPFALLWFFSGGKWIGFGDAKLSLGIGWLLGLSGGISAILTGFWAGALVSVALLLISKLPEKHVLRRSTFFSRPITAKTEIPFAPFLIFGTALVFFFNLSVIAF